MAITVDSFQRAADLNLSGELEVKGKNVENLGTIGNKIVRFFQTIGALLCICKRPPSEQERQAKAINAFRRALTKEYGATITENITRGLKGALTGAKVNAAITDANRARTEARRQIQQNTFENEKKVASFLPGVYIAEPMTRDVSLRNNNNRNNNYDGQLLDKLRNFRQLCTEAGVSKKDLATFEGLFNPNDNNEHQNAHTLYREMLRGASFFYSKANTEILPDDEARKNAKFLLQFMKKLKSGAEVGAARQQFQNCTQSVKDILTAIARPNTGGDMQTMLINTQQSFSNLLGLAGHVTDDPYMDQSLFHAIFGTALFELPEPDKKALLDRSTKSKWNSENNPMSGYDDPSQQQTTSMAIKIGGALVVLGYIS